MWYKVNVKLEKEKWLYNLKYLVGVYLSGWGKIIKVNFMCKGHRRVTLGNWKVKSHFGIWNKKTLAFFY